MTTRVSSQAIYRGGTGTPLVLLHPLGASWRVWKPVIPALESNHAVFAPTLMGHCGAAPASARPTVAAITDAVERQMDDARLGTAHLAGCSLGGRVALELSRRGRSRSVVCFAPAVSNLPPRALAVSRLLIRAGHSTQPLLSLAQAFDPAGLCSRFVVYAIAVQAGMPSGADAYRAYSDFVRCKAIWRILEAMALEPEFPPLDAPPGHIRIAWGLRDRVLPYHRDGQALLRLIPEAECVLLPGVGHVPMATDPDLVAATILEVTLDIDSDDEPALLATG
jgi:pimeloyl-ACP methyl ester carboxylesterase